MYMDSTAQHVWIALQLVLDAPTITSRYDARCSRPGLGVWARLQRPRHALGRVPAASRTRPCPGRRWPRQGARLTAGRRRSGRRSRRSGPPPAPAFAATRSWQAAAGQLTAGCSRGGRSPKRAAPAACSMPLARRAPARALREAQLTAGKCRSRRSGLPRASAWPLRPAPRRRSPRRSPPATKAGGGPAVWRGAQGRRARRRPC